MSRFFLFWFDLFSRRRWLFLLLLSVTIVLIVCIGLRIRLAEDISKVLPRSEKVEQYLTVINQAAFADELVIFLGPADTAHTPETGELIQFAAELADSVKINLMPGLVARLRDRTDDTRAFEIWNEIHNNLPVYLDEEDYARLDSMTADSAIGLAVQKAYKNLVSPVGFISKEYILKDPLGLTALGLKKTESLHTGEDYRILNGYIFSKDLRYLLMFLTPAQKSTETAKNARILKSLDRYLSAMSRRYDGRIKGGYFGSMAVSVANASQLKRDILMTSSLAVVLLVLFIGLYFGHFSVIPPIVLTTLMSAGFSVALLSLMGREISAVSLGFGAVLLGIAIAYAIHYLNHLREEGDGRKIIRQIALPIVMSSLISSGDFFTLLLVRSEAVRDLGLFAGFSILAAGLFNLIFLPQITRGINRDLTRPGPVNRFVVRLASYPVEKLRWLPAGILGLTILFYFTSGKVSFESDLTGMSHMTKDLKEAEATLDNISQYGLRSVFVVSRGKTPDQALDNTVKLLERMEKLKADGLVRKYTAITEIAVPESLQKQRIGRWNEFWTPLKKAEVKRKLEAEAIKNGFKASAFGDFETWLDKAHAVSSPLNPGESLKSLTEPYISAGDGSAAVTTILKVRQEDKAKVYEALKSEGESFIFDKQFLTSTFIEILSHDFNRLVIISLLIVFGVLLISYGRIELALITFIPMFISWIWTLGIMGILGIRLNIFNIIITSFVFGLGIDYALFSIQGMLQEYKYGHANVNSYRSSVLMDAITTLIGLGVLVLAVHPALKAMAVAAIIGIISVWFITWSLEPILFRWLVSSGGKKRPFPVTLRDFYFAIQSLLIFITGSLTLMIYGLVVFKVFRAKRGPLKASFHRLMMTLSHFLIYSNFLSRKKIIGRKEASLKKPAVLIANHQSHIDIALMLMLHPRLLELTNDRVQGSSFYGPLVKMADFYAVSEGMESLVQKLRKNVEEGYSVLVFPEGTRSPDTRIQRFHQGAFYLARELGTDILPVIIHGSGPIFPKGEYFLRKGRCTIRFLPRISPEDPRFGKELLEKSRNFRKYMAAEYRKVAEIAETPAYYREKLIRNYIFKGPVLEWYLKVKIRLEKNYSLFHEVLPEEGHITDIGCGYGFLSYMMSFLSDRRRITGIDYDAEKIETALHVPAKHERIHFICGDVLQMEIPPSRAFILADVLHYFPEEEQEALLGRCLEKLDAGGIIIIRDADRGMKRKHFGTRLSEYFSTRTGFNRTRGDEKKLYFTSGETILAILNGYGLEVEISDEAKLTSNLLYIGRKQHD